MLEIYPETSTTQSDHERLTRHLPTHPTNRPDLKAKIPDPNPIPQNQTQAKKKVREKTHQRIRPAYLWLLPIFWHQNPAQIREQI
jgi:hypothetical protein